MNSKDKMNKKHLRQKAEEKHKLQLDKTAEIIPAESDLLKMTHELQVYQIELELQKDELIQAKELEEHAKEKYTSIFDLAPSAFFILSDGGLIEEINLMGARMLGFDRRSLIKKNFAYFIPGKFRKTFDDFHKRTLSTETAQSCEITFNMADGRPLFALLSGTMTDDRQRSIITAIDFTARKQAEIELKQSEAKYRQLAENSTSIVYRIQLKPEFKFDYVSPSSTAIIGYTPEDHYNDPNLGFKLVHPDDRKLLENSTLLVNGEPLELRWIRKDGKVIWTEQRNVLIFDEKNEPFALEGNARDITDRKLLELDRSKEAEINSMLLGLFANAPTLEDKELFDKALDIAVKITDSKIGFFHQVSENQLEIILTTWNDEAKKNCTTVYDNHYPIEKAGNWADCVRQKRAVIYNDYPVSPHQKGLPQGHTHISRILSIPVVQGEKVRLIFGVGNKSDDYTDWDVNQIQAVANDLYKILEKRKVELDLKKSEERWQFAIEGSNDGIWDWNLHTDEVYFSKRWKEMLGFEPGELLGTLHEWKSRVHPDDLEEVILKLKRHFNHETADYSTEHRMMCKDGSWKWILDRGKVIEWTKDGQPSRMVGTHTDITNRKFAEEVVRKSEEKFRIVADNAYNWEFWEDSDGQWIHHSPSCEKLTGYSVEEFTKDKDLLLKIIHPEDKEAYTMHHQESFTHHAQGRHFFRIITKRGEIRDIEHVCQAIYNDSGVFIGIRGSNIDITVRKNAEDRLRESEFQYRNLANSGSALIWTSGTDKLCDYFNIPWLKFTGRTLEQEIGNGWAEGVHPDDFNRCLETYVSAFDRREPFEMEYRLRHSSGQYKWILDLGTPNFNSKGEFLGYIGHCFDISERKETELQLHQSEEKYRSIFESVQEVYFEASMDGILLEVSPSIEKITKGLLIREEMIGKSFVGYYSKPADRDNYFAKLLAQKRVNDYELWFKNKDESLIPLAVSSAISFDDDGNPTKVTGILRDITERKNAEIELTEMLRKLNESNIHLEKRVEERTKEILDLSNLQKAILQYAGLAIISTSAEGIIEVFNDAAAEMLGYKAEEVVGKQTPVIFHDPEEILNRSKLLALKTGEEAKSDFGLFQQILVKSSSQTDEWTYVRKGGEKFPVKLTISSIKDSGSKVVGYIGIASDITKEKLFVETLRLSEERFHNMFFNHAAVMLLVDPETGRILEANKAAERFYGLAFNENSELLISDLNTLSKDQIEVELINSTQQKRNHFVFTHRLASGEFRTVEVHSSPIEFSGKTVSFLVIHDITERKILESALQMQSSAFESFALTIIITDINGRIKWVNSAFSQLTGYSIEEVLGKTPGQLTSSGKQDAEFYKDFWETILNKKVWKGELINRRKDGTLYYEEETITPVLDAQGNISSFIAIKIDITERKKLYQELANQSRRLEVIIKGTNAGTWEWNIETGETTFNEQWANIIGYTLDEISPVNIETWMKFAHPDDLKLSSELLDQHFSGKLDYYSFESRMKHKNGEWIWVWDRGRVHEWTADGKPLLMSGTHLDITHRKNAELDLLWNKSFLELMSNSSPLGFLVVDNRNDDILYFNHRFCEIWEIQHIEEQMLRGELKNNDIIPYCLPVLADIPAFAESCKPLQDEANRVILEDEITFTENRTVRRFTTQIRGKHDEYYGRFYIFENITERKLAEAEIKNARIEAEKANHAKSEFLSRMSHELRTPMNSILGFAQLMEMGELNPKQKKGISHILSNGKHLLDLINEVLDIAGIESGRQILSSESINVAAIIKEITDSIQVVADRRNISVEFLESPGEGHIVLADRLRLKQILINLVNNAVKYNKDGGTVKIYSNRASSGTSAENVRQNIRISISDSGYGIDPDDLGKLFQPFERIGADRTETEGTGLGLMVVKKLTEAMGGTVGVESVLGNGSTFWIELPVSEFDDTEKPGNDSKKVPELNDIKRDSTVLYIEDNLSNIELVEEIFVTHFPEIQLVNSLFGKETVSLAKKYKPKIILLDLDLPDIKGIEVLEQLMTDPVINKIPVIIVSADAMPFQVEKLLKAGAFDYLIKPLDIIQFLKVINRHLNL